VVDPADYETVLAELDAYGEVQAATRFALAKKVFAHTARYDGMITNYLTSLDAEDKPQQFPAVFNRQWEKVQDLATGMPVVSRVITVDGDACEKPQNLIVPVGTAYEDVLNAAGLKGGVKLGKVVAGGAMMGPAVET
jgi:hypothetical protein